MLKKFILNKYHVSDIKLMNYNFLNYSAADTTTRNAYFTKIIFSVNKRVFAVQKMTSSSGTDGFKKNILQMLLSKFI